MYNRAAYRTCFAFLKLPCKHRCLSIKESPVHLRIYSRIICFLFKSLLMNYFLLFKFLIHFYIFRKSAFKLRYGISSSLFIIILIFQADYFHFSIRQCFFFFCKFTNGFFFFYKLFPVILNAFI